jgi:hypothetical protein
VCLLKPQGPVLHPAQHIRGEGEEQPAEMTACHRHLFHGVISCEEGAIGLASAIP